MTFELNKPAAPLPPKMTYTYQTVNTKMVIHPVMLFEGTLIQSMKSGTYSIYNPADNRAYACSTTFGKEYDKTKQPPLAFEKSIEY